MRIIKFVTLKCHYIYNGTWYLKQTENQRNFNPKNDVYKCLIAFLLCFGTPHD